MALVHTSGIIIDYIYRERNTDKHDKSTNTHADMSHPYMNHEVIVKS